MFSFVSQVHSNGKTSPVGYEDTEDSTSSSCSTPVTEASHVQVTNTGVPSVASVHSPNPLASLGGPQPTGATSLPDWYNPSAAMPPPAPSIEYHHHHSLNHHLASHQQLMNQAAY